MASRGEDDKLPVGYAPLLSALLDDPGAFAGGMGERDREGERELAAEVGKADVWMLRDILRDRPALEGFVGVWRADFLLGLSSLGVPEEDGEASIARCGSVGCLRREFGLELAVEAIGDELNGGWVE